MITISKETKQAILSTWGGIAGDAYEVCDDDNEIAMELVLDANRLTMNGYETADKEISALCMEHGFGVVRESLSRQIQLL